MVVGIGTTRPPKPALFRKRLQKVETLPAADHRAVLKLIDTGIPLASASGLPVASA
jgi:hypothetical protein